MAEGAGHTGLGAEQVRRLCWLWGKQVEGSVSQVGSGSTG